MKTRRPFRRIRPVLSTLGFLLVVASYARAIAKLELQRDWRFRGAGEETWYPASVPGCLHLDLMSAKLIPDPFYRDNEQKLQWIGKTDWEYETAFSVPQEILGRRNVELVFEGLDTYATVFLNGTEVLSANNMFREWRVECGRLLKPDGNILLVRFRSPINEILPVMARLSYQLPAANDQGEKTSPWTRKAPYHFGWDWGPRFVTAGVWRPVRLEAWDEVRLRDLFIVQKQVTRELARIEAQVELELSASEPRQVSIILDEPDGELAPVRQSLTLARGTSTVTLGFEVRNPRLWWPNGLGEQLFYTFRARVFVAGSRGTALVPMASGRGRVPEGQRHADELTVRTGLRSIELRQVPDEWGKSFEFVVNGARIFAKGGNWIPADSFVTRITRERYRQLVQSCRDANMNMLRVWGGGIYESRDFYELCDEMGILVWQDFMFACSMYPGEPAFLDNVREEAIYNVRRIRNHPSLALWCGNNEIETAWQHWGWKETLPARLWTDYLKIFHEILPAACAQNDPLRPYWPSSPSSNLEADPDSQRMGDVHYWDVWHGAKPFREYEKQSPRFMSEYGFQSFPEIRTVESYTLPEDRDIQSPVMMAHQKHPRGNQLIREYMLRDFPEPRDFPSFLYASQLLQAEGIKIGAEHLRRLMPRTMGSLYWQINDCWPVASWSSIDYFGRWKALQYYARRFYREFLVSPVEQDGEIRVFVVSDRPSEVDGRLEAMLLDFDGNEIEKRSVPVRVAGLQGRNYLTFRREDLAKDRDSRSLVLHVGLDVGGRTVSTNSFYFEPVKNLSLPQPSYSIDCSEIDGGVLVSLLSDKLARGVYLTVDGFEGQFTDNFLEILPGRSANVEFRSQEKIDPNEFRRSLKVVSLVDAFR